MNSLKVPAAKISLLVLLALLLPLVALAEEPGTVATGTASAAGTEDGGEALGPDAKILTYKLDGADLFTLETSPANGTIASFKLLTPQYSQKERAAVPGEPEDHYMPGPMEMVRTWDPEFYPFQTRIADVGDKPQVWQRLSEVPTPTVIDGVLQGLARPPEASEGASFGVTLGGTDVVTPVSAFVTGGARLKAVPRQIQGPAVLFQAVPFSTLDKGAHAYRLVAHDERQVTYVWPDPKQYLSSLYEERRLSLVGPYELRLDVFVHNLSKDALPHRLLVSVFGFQDPAGEEPGMLNPVVDQVQGICSAGGDVERDNLNAIVEETQAEGGISPPGKVDFAGIETRYFMTALAPTNMAQSRCLLRAWPYGVIETIIESQTTAIAAGRDARCLPAWYSWSPAQASCDALRDRLGVEAATPYIQLKKNYLDQKSNLDVATQKGWTALLESMKETLVYGFAVYIGPKDIERMSAVGHNLDGAIDFWIVGIIAKPMLYLLRLFHGLIPHWGIAIILLTLLVKLLTWYPSQKSFVQMKEMQRLKPEIDKIKEKFKDDRSRLNQETMALYKRYKINPLGGCLPMALQMPIWIALYRTIYSSVELYQAPLFLWIQDLSSPDPYFVLPVIMGISMFLQQLLTPTTMDEGQAKMMKYMMPLMFTGFMLFLPSGLVLYIFVNTLLSLAQQYLIHRRHPVAPAT